MVLVIRSLAEAARDAWRQSSSRSARLGLGGNRLLRRQLTRQRERRRRRDIHRRMLEVTRRRIGAAALGIVGLATGEAGQRGEAGEDAPAPSPDRLHGFPLRASMIRAA